MEKIESMGGLVFLGFGIGKFFFDKLERDTVIWIYDYY